MDPIPSDFERSVRRSRIRVQVLLVLSSLGEAYVGQLAAHTRLPWGRVRAALEGEPPRFSAELSLVGLGLARRVESGARRVYEITPAGRRKARSVLSAISRRRERGGRKEVAFDRLRLAGISAVAGRAAAPGGAEGV